MSHLLIGSSFYRGVSSTSASKAILGRPEGLFTDHGDQNQDQDQRPQRIVWFRECMGTTEWGVPELGKKQRLLACLVCCFSSFCIISQLRRSSFNSTPCILETRCSPGVVDLNLVVMNKLPVCQEGLWKVVLRTHLCAARRHQSFRFPKLGDNRVWAVIKFELNCHRDIFQTLTYCLKRI